MTEEAHVFDLLPAYALGCLGPEEEAQVNRHLAFCSTCRIELTGYERLTGDLALAIPEVAPPAHLKRRLTTAIQPAASQPVRSLAGLWARPALWGAAVGLVLLLVLGGANLWLWQRINTLEQRLEPAGMRSVALAGTEAAPQASGLLIISHDGNHGTLVVADLPPLPPDQQYQLWLTKNGGRVSGAVFSVDPEGYGAELISSPEPLSSYAACGISIEPAGGSPAPTGPRVMSGSLE